MSGVKGLSRVTGFLNLVNPSIKVAVGYVGGGKSETSDTTVLAGVNPSKLAREVLIVSIFC